MLERIILSLIFLFLAAFFSGSEIGFISIDRQLLLFKEKKDSYKLRFAKLLNKFVNSYENVIYISLIGTNISIIASVQILSRSLHHQFKYSYIFLSFVYPVFTLIVAEMIPKLLYSKKPYTLTKFSIIPYSIFYYIFYPVIILFKFIDIILKKITKNKFYTENKLSNEKFFSYLKSNFSIHARYSADLIDNIILTLDKKAKEILKPVEEYNLIVVEKKIEEKIRKNMNKKINLNSLINILNNNFNIILNKKIEDNYNLSLNEKIEVIFNSSKNYVLIFTKKNEIIGYLSTKCQYSENREIRIESPLIVPFSRKLKNIIIDMKYYSKDIIFVVDEYNSIEGVIEKDVLFKNLYESFYTNIKSTEGIQKISKNEYIIDCSVDIAYINKILKLNLKSRYYRTLNGFLQEITGKIPQPGDVITMEHFEIKIIRSTLKEVKLIKLKML